VSTVQTDYSHFKYFFEQLQLKTFAAFSFSWFNFA